MHLLHLHPADPRARAVQVKAAAGTHNHIHNREIEIVNSHSHNRGMKMKMILTIQGIGIETERGVEIEHHHEPKHPRPNPHPNQLPNPNQPLISEHPPNDPRHNDTNPVQTQKRIQITINTWTINPLEVRATPVPTFRERHRRPLHRVNPQVKVGERSVAVVAVAV